MSTPRKRIERRTPSGPSLFCTEGSNERYVALNRAGDRVSVIPRNEALNFFGSLESWSAHVALSHLRRV